MLSKPVALNAPATSFVTGTGAGVRCTLGSLQDELDSFEGNFTAIERRRAAHQRADIESQIEIAAAAQSHKAVADLELALRVFDQLSERRLADAAERERQWRPQRMAAPAANAIVNGSGARAVTVEFSTPDGLQRVEGVFAADDVPRLVEILDAAGVRSVLGI